MRAAQVADARRPNVDYDAVARSYQLGRELSDVTIQQWREAISEFVPERGPLVVLDVGAGTGIFTRAWCGWPDCLVIAIEPSSGMRRQAFEAGLPHNAVLLAGVGETISLRNSSAHVAWLSSVLHHLRDAAECIRELRRTLTPDGVVLVRSVFADRGDVGWLPFFPGAAQARSRFPLVAATTAIFEECGFNLLGGAYMSGNAWATPHEAARWARDMRKVDSLLATFSDDDFERGVSALEAAPEDQQLADRLSVLAFG